MSRFICCTKNSLSLSSRVFIKLALTFIVTVAMCVGALGQSETSTSARPEIKPSEKTESNNASNQPNKDTKPPFTLRVTEDQIIGVTLKARTRR